MTLVEPAVSPAEPAAQSSDNKAATACAFCRRRLAEEFYFTCRRCNASYCYIHMSRHQPVPCARMEARRRRTSRMPVPVAAPQAARARPGDQSILPGAESLDRCSANV